MTHGVIGGGQGRFCVANSMESDPIQRVPCSFSVAKVAVGCSDTASRIADNRPGDRVRVRAHVHSRRYLSGTNNSATRFYPDLRALNFDVRPDFSSTPHPSVHCSVAPIAPIIHLNAEPY